MNPTKEDIRIINVEVSMASLIGIPIAMVIIGTQKTPPPTPAMVAKVPKPIPRSITIRMTKKFNSIIISKSVHFIFRFLIEMSILFYANEKKIIILRSKKHDLIKKLNISLT